MEREPRTPPSPDPAAGSTGWPRWMFFAGGGLLVAGIALIAVASAVTGSEQIDEVGFRLAAENGATATPNAYGTISMSPTPTPKPTRTKRAPAVKKTTSKVTSSPTVTKAPKKKAKVIRPKAGTVYRLYNVATGKCMAKLVYTVTTTQELCEGSGKMKLVATRVNAGVQLYQVHETGPGGLCLDPPGQVTNATGTPLSSVPCLTPAADDNQEWQLRDVGMVSKGREVYALVNAASGLCLDVLGNVANGSDRPAGLSLTLATCTEGGYDDRLWIFY